MLWRWILNINLFVFREAVKSVKHSSFLLLSLVLQYFVLISVLLIIISVLQGPEVTVGLVTWSKRREGKNQAWDVLPFLSPEQKIKQNNNKTQPTKQKTPPKNSPQKPNKKLPNPNKQGCGRKGQERRNEWALRASWWDLFWIFLMKSSLIPKCPFAIEMYYFETLCKRMLVKMGAGLKALLH